MRITKNKNNKLIVIIPVILLLLAACVAAALLLTPLGNWLRPSQTQSDNSKTRDTNAVDYSGPSQSDIDESQNAKKNNDKTSITPGSEGGKTKVSVGISYADVYNGNLEIRAFTNGIIEGNGVCSATVTDGTTVITQTSTAFVDVSTTQCNPIYVSASRLSTGKWQVKVMFSSPDAEGSSDPVEVKI